MSPEQLDDLREEIENLREEIEPDVTERDLKEIDRALEYVDLARTNPFHEHNVLVVLSNLERQQDNSLVADEINSVIANWR